MELGPFQVEIGLDLKEVATSMSGANVEGTQNSIPPTSDFNHASKNTIESQASPI